MTTTHYPVPLAVRRLGAALVSENRGSPVCDAVEVEIQYCAVSNYRTVAERLHESIRAACRDSVRGTNVKLTPTRGGHFEVTVGTRLIFSKRANRRLPSTDEVLYHVEAALNGRR